MAACPGPNWPPRWHVASRQAGIDVIDLGMVATPMTYFAAYELNTDSGVMVTGCHNPPDYNGLKMVIGGETLSGDTIQQLRVRLEQNDLSHGNKSGANGSYKTHDIAEAYLSRIACDVKLARPMKIIVDCRQRRARRLCPGTVSPHGLRRWRSCFAMWTAISPTTIPIPPSGTTWKTSSPG